MDLANLELIKRYDNNIDVVPIEGPVKNRLVVTAYDVSSLAQGERVNDAAIDAHLSLVCHCFNGHFSRGCRASQVAKVPCMEHSNECLPWRQGEIIRGETSPTRMASSALSQRGVGRCGLPHFSYPRSKKVTGY